MVRLTKSAKEGELWMIDPYQLEQTQFNAKRLVNQKGNTMSVETYQCAKCLETYEKGWTDEEAEKEAEENFGFIEIEERAIICDDCYREIMGLPQIGDIQWGNHG